MCGGCSAAISDIVGSVSMILLEVDPQGLAVFPLEGDLPRAVDGNGVAAGLALERVKPPPGRTQLSEVLCRVERGEPPPHPLARVAPHPARFADVPAFNAAVGVAALPASLVFGLLWSRFGAPAPFAFGFGLALTAALLLLIVPERPGARVALEAHMRYRHVMNRLRSYRPIPKT